MNSAWTVTCSYFGYIVLALPINSVYGRQCLLIELLRWLVDGSRKYLTDIAANVENIKVSTFLTFD